MRIRLPLLTAVTAAVTAGVLAMSAPAQAGSLVFLSEGHVDIVDVAFEEGAFEISVHDETVVPDVERDPDDVVFVVNPEATTTVPNDPAFAFLGAPGATVHILPQADVEGLLFAGLATEEIEPGILANEEVTFRFQKVFGPDGFSLFGLNSDGSPDVVVDSENGLPDSFTLDTGLHVHQNWAFEKDGIYLIKVDVTGVLAADNSTVTSEPVWLKFVVLK